jgi:hypothetical protein
MDSGTQQDISDSGAPASAAGTAEDAGASDTSAGIDKGKRPTVPEVRTNLAPALVGQTTPAAPEQPAPEIPNPEPTAAPAKTGTLKIYQIIKTATSPAATAPASAKPAHTSSAMTLHYGKAAARPSFFQTLELEGRVSLLTKSDKSLGSLKEHCIKWNDADYKDSASSKKKNLPGVPAANPKIAAAKLAAKPIPIACELLSIQQRFHLLANSTNVSVLLISPQSTKISVVRDTDI